MNHIERIYDGENQWWKYLLVIIFGFFGGQVLGLFPSIVVVAGQVIENPNQDLDFDAILNLTQLGYSKNFNLFMMLVPFVMMLAISMLLVNWLHKRKFSEIVNGTQSIRWGRIKYAFLIWFLISALSIVAEYFLEPELFHWNFNLENFSILVLISVIMIPLQTTAEEYFFRGYFFQSVGAATRSRLAAAIVPGIIFGLLHSANPEVQEYGFWMAMPHYLLSGIVFGLLTAVDDGMELALGAHAANNLFLSIFITEKSAVFQTDALFYVSELALDFSALIMAIAINIIFIILLHRKYKFNWKILTSPPKENNFPIS